MQCRICFGPEQQRRALIAPCDCRGSMALVHRECLDTWRRHEIMEGNMTGATSCAVCKSAYTTNTRQRLRKFLAVIRNVMAAIHAIFTGITVLLIPVMFLTLACAYWKIIDLDSRVSVSLYEKYIKILSGVFAPIGVISVAAGVLTTLVECTMRVLLAVQNKFNAVPKVVDRGHTQGPLPSDHIRDTHQRADVALE